MAGIQYFFLLLALPLYFFGEQLRMLISIPPGMEISTSQSPGEEMTY